MSELVKRLLDGGPLTQEELEIASAELDAILEKRDANERNFALGRRIASDLSRARAEQVRATWFSEALQVLREQPGIALKPLSFEVHRRSADSGVTKPNGQPHSPATIYNFLVAESARLAAAQKSFTTQACLVEKSSDISA